MPALLYLLCTLYIKKSTAKFKLVEKLIVSSTHRLSLASCADDYWIRKLLDWSSDWLISCCQWQSD